MWFSFTNLSKVEFRIHRKTKKKTKKNSCNQDQNFNWNYWMVSAFPVWISVRVCVSKKRMALVIEINRVFLQGRCVCQRLVTYRSEQLSLVCFLCSLGRCFYFWWSDLQPSSCSAFKPWKTAFNGSFHRTRAATTAVAAAWGSQRAHISKA